MSVHSGTRKLDRLPFYGAIVGATGFSFVFTTTTTTTTTTAATTTASTTTIAAASSSTTTTTNLSVGYTVLDFLHTRVLRVVGIKTELHL